MRFHHKILASLLASICILVASCTPAAQPTSPSAPASSAQPAAPAASNAAPKSSAAPSEPAKAPQTLKKINVAFPLPTLTSVPFYIAIEKGFAKEEGLDATMTQIAGALGVKSMVAGEIDFSLSAGSALAAGVQDAPIKVVLVGVDWALSWLYSKPEIKSIKDLSGKTVAVDAVGGSQDVSARVVIQKHGGKVDDIVFMGIGGTGRVPALRAGSIDAAVLNSPENLQVVGSNFNMLAFFGDDIRSLIGGVGVTEKKIKEDPDTVQRMVNASLKGLKYLKQNKQGSIPLMMKFLSFDEKAATDLYDDTVRYFTNDGTSDNDTLQAVIKEQVTALKVKGDVPVDKAFDLTFVKKANQQLAASGWKAQ